MNDLEKGWNEVAQKLLLGKKIVNVRYLSKEEMDDMGWYVRTVAFQTEDGLWFFPEVGMMKEMMGVRCLPLMKNIVACP